MSNECPMPEPTAQHHKLLEQVGTWDVKSKHYMEPGKPAVEGTAVDRVTAVGPFWTVSRYESTFFGQPFVGQCTMGYLPEKECFVMTWVDSMAPFLFVMEGNFDAAGKVLTMTGKGPSMAGPGLVDWKSTMIIKDKDHQVLKMSMGGFEFMENTYTRRK